MKLLPGQQNTNGVSNYLFGSNHVDYNNAFVSNAGVQAQLKANNIQVVRCPMEIGTVNCTDGQLDAMVAACNAAGVKMLAILRYSDLTFSDHVVSHLGANCNLYELGNEPDLTGVSWQNYLAAWNAHVPTWRATNPNAAFIGPVLGAYSNVQKYLVPWLQGCVSSGVLPDGVSFHDYPCTDNLNTIPKATCALRAPNIGADGAKLSSIVQGIVGKTLPICITEWNVDAYYGQSGGQSYSTNTPGNATFLSQFTLDTIDGMAAHNIALACNFEINAYLVSDSAPSTPEPEMQAMQTEYSKYIGASIPPPGLGSPYGMTLELAKGHPSPHVSPQTITDLNGLGTGLWLRYQLPWKYIEYNQVMPAPTSYTSSAFDWSALDDAVSQCNAAGVNILVPIQGPPSWYLTIRASDGATVTAGTGDFANATDFARTGGIFASRYNGTVNSPTTGAPMVINAFQIENEDYDSKTPRDIQSQWLVPVVNAAVPAIKAAYPGVSVGVCSVRKTQTLAMNHITNWVTNLFTYTGGCGRNIDWLDFHYYRGQTPQDPTIGTTDTPSIATELAGIRAIAASYGFPTMPVWCNEFGWDVYDDGTGTVQTVTQAQQSQYTLSMMDAMRTGGGGKCMIYTMNPNSRANLTKTPPTSTNTKSIEQVINNKLTYLKAYGDWKNYISTYPLWGAPPSFYSATVLADSPQGYYRLDEAAGTKAVDSSGNGNAGTYSATGVTYNEPGLINGDPDTCVLFDGSTGKMTGPAGILPNGWAAITVEAWFSLSNTSFATTVPLWANDNTHSNNKGFTLSLAAGGTAAVFNVGNGTTAGQVNVTHTFLANTLYYVAGTYNGTTMSVYISPATSTPDGTTAFTGTIGTSTHNPNVGFNPNNSNAFPGLIDEAAIYNTCLTGARILAHYNAGSVSTGAIPVLAVTPTSITPTTPGVTRSGATYSAVVTLSEPTSSAGTAHWTSSSSLVGVTFTPSSGSLTPGGSVSVTIANIPTTAGSFTFSGSEGETPVSSNWSTVGVVVTGGFALFANGAGTASFDHFRVTGFPDPSLNLTTCGTVANSVINWNVLTPPLTGLTVDTSLDGVNWTNIPFPNSPIAGVATQPDAASDIFTTNSAIGYTDTFQNGGAVSDWTWDTANKRLVATGGTNGLLLIADLTSVGDVSLFMDSDYADNAALVFHAADVSNFYYLSVHDASSGSNPNTMKLNKLVAASNTVEATASISFTRNTYHRILVTMIGNVITAYFDGTQILTYTDSSPLAAGQCGLRNGTAGAGSTSQFYQFTVQPQGQALLPVDNYVYTRHTLTSTDPAQTPQVLDSAALVTGPSIGLGSLIPGATYQRTFCNANFDDLKKQSDYIQYINSSRQMIFTPRTANPAPWILQATDAANSNILVQNLKVEYSGDLYRNRETLRNVQAVETFTQQFTGDGTSTNWTLPYPVATGTVPTILLNDVSSVTIGIQGQSTGQQYYYTPGGTGITQDASQAILNGLQTLTVTWQGTFTTDVTVDNTGQFPGTTSQAQYADIQAGGGPVTTTGIVEDVFDVSQQTYTANMDVPTATNYANQLLQEFGVIGRTATFRTMKPGLAAGMVQPAFIPQHLMQNVQMLLTNVTTSAQNGGSDGGPIFWYDCTACEGPSVGDWVKAVGSGAVFG